MKNKRTLMFLGLYALFLSIAVANAQINNKPFSFKGTPDGGIGMSIGGQQAIINQKILGVTPNNLVRGANGILLNITKNSGGSAIVSYPDGGGVIPSFKGTSFRGSNEMMTVGAFNPYFIADKSRSSFTSFSSMASSSAAVSTWTTRVATGGLPASYSPNSVVDNWTSMVFIQQR